MTAEVRAFLNHTSHSVCDLVYSAVFVLGHCDFERSHRRSHRLGSDFISFLWRWNYSDIGEKLITESSVLFCLQRVLDSSQCIRSQPVKSLAHFLNETVHLGRPNDLGDRRTAPVLFTGDFSNARTADVTLHDVRGLRRGTIVRGFLAELGWI